jgi:tRNA-dihydrouridine synthase B
MFNIGPWVIDKPTILAPMAGVSDLPFRQLCSQLGAGLVVSEMVTADSRLWGSRKSQQRLNHFEGKEPRSVQLVGYDPTMLAEAAKANADLGAQIIDINMGCPAKKVCKKAAGSALLKNEKLVSDILHNVVNAVDIPVTLKIRTGWDQSNRNGVAIARIAENSGIQALAVHGRTRACAFKGNAEYDTIKNIVSAVNIPVFANGDISSPEKAKWVIEHTGANAVMIGRGAQGNPWIFREINEYLATGKRLSCPCPSEVSKTLLGHIQKLHEFYGEVLGVKIARKHVSWYLQSQCLVSTNAASVEYGDNKDSSLLSESITQEFVEFRKTFNRIDSAQKQHQYIDLYFENLATKEEKAA